MYMKNLHCTGILLFLSVFSQICAQPSTSLQWAKNLGGTSYDYGTAVSVDGSGNVYTTGYFRNTADFDPGTGTYNLTSAGINDVFVSKLDASGNFVWAFKLGGSDDDFGKGIGTDVMGNVYIAGLFKDTLDFDPGPGTYYLNPANTNIHLFVLKLDNAGDFVYAKCVDLGMMPPVYQFRFHIDPSGNIYGTGLVYGSPDFDPGPAVYPLYGSGGGEEILVFKWDSNGSFVWAKLMGGTSIDKGYDIYADASGNVYTTGTFSSTADFDPGPGNYYLTSDGWDDIFVSKLDVNGNFIWAKQFGGTDNGYGKGITADASGNVYITGSFQGTVDFDPGPGILEYFGGGNTDIFLVSLNSSGDLNWANEFGSGSSSSGEGGYGITSDANYIYVVGVFVWTSDFDPGTGISNLNSVGGDDIFVAKYDFSGNFIWAKSMGGSTDSDYGLSVKVDASGNVYTAGYFQSTVDFNTGYQINNLTSSGQTDAFVLKMSQCTNTTHTITTTACDSYTLNSQTYTTSGTYYQYQINSQGCDSIITINLTVNQSPAISTQPVSYNKCINSNVMLEITAGGTMPLSYSWQLDGSLISGETNSAINLNNLQLSDDGIYTCVVTNVCGSTTSDNAVIKVIQLSVDPGPDSTFCNDNAIQMQATASSNYPSESGTLQYLWSPSTGLSNTNTANPMAQPLADQNYSVTVSDQIGCHASGSVLITSITPVSIINQPQSQNGCLNGNKNISVSVNGTSPISYQWKKNGNIITGQTLNMLNFGNLQQSDEGNYTCVVSNYCITLTSSAATLKVIEITFDAGTADNICSGDNTLIQTSASSDHPVESGNFSYSWSPTTGLSPVNSANPTASPDTTTTYNVTVSDQVGCIASDNVSVFVQNPFTNEQICLVTVDTLSWKNRIMWEKTPGVGTLGYNVYKEVATNVYSAIGFVLYGDPATFVDIYSQPESFANRYKISVVDTCGSESPKTYYHNTMNLTIAAFGSTMGLSWTPYSDESGTFVPSLYYIYRGTTPDNMTFLASIPGTQTSYNDVNVYDVYYYIVGVMKPGGCNINKSDEYSYSNKKDNSGLVGINSTLYLPGTIIISPNPMSTSATLTIPNFSYQLSVIGDLLTVTDITGKVVRRMSDVKTDNFQINSSSNLQIKIERGDLKPGIYFVELNAGRTYRGKLVIE